MAAIGLMSASSLEPLFQAAERGSPEAQQALFTELYGVLKSMAQRELLRHRALTLGANTLLHETYLKLARRDGLHFPDRARFLAYPSRAMRGLVIDYAGAVRPSNAEANSSSPACPLRSPPYRSGRAHSPRRRHRRARHPRPGVGATR